MSDQRIGKINNNELIRIDCVWKCDKSELLCECELTICDGQSALIRSSSGSKNSCWFASQEVLSQLEVTLTHKQLRLNVKAEKQIPEKKNNNIGAKYNSCGEIKASGTFL